MPDETQPTPDASPPFSFVSKLLAGGGGITALLRPVLDELAEAHRQTGRAQALIDVLRDGHEREVASKVAAAVAATNDKIGLIREQNRSELQKVEASISTAQQAVAKARAASREEVKKAKAQARVDAQMLHDIRAETESIVHLLLDLCAETDEELREAGITIFDGKALAAMVAAYVNDQRVEHDNVLNDTGLRSIVDILEQWSRGQRWRAARYLSHGRIGWKPGEMADSPGAPGHLSKLIEAVRSNGEAWGPLAERWKIPFRTPAQIATIRDAVLAMDGVSSCAVNANRVRQGEDGIEGTLDVRFTGPAKPDDVADGLLPMLAKIAPTVALEVNDREYVLERVEAGSLVHRVIDDHLNGNPPEGTEDNHDRVKLYERLKAKGFRMIPDDIAKLYESEVVHAHAWLDRNDEGYTPPFLRRFAPGVR